MSLLDSYRRKLISKNEELSRLQTGKSKEQAKSAALSLKISSAMQASQRSKSVSVISTKLREIERYRKEQAALEKKIADYEAKISKVQKDIISEQKKVSREEDNLYKKNIALAKKQEREHELKMKNIDATLSNHDSLHRRVINDIEQLKRLPEKINVLFLAANPVDQPQLRLDEEARLIKDMVRKSKHRDSISFDSQWAVQPMDVLQAINEVQPTIVHFSGHGSDTDQIVFQDKNGNTKLVSQEAIVQTMMASSSDIRLVFFNTCYSYNQAEAVTKHVEAAIGMNTSIGDEAARVFSSQFYSSIGFGLSIKSAFEQAKALVMMEGLDEEDTPELFVQEGLDANDLIIVRPEGLQ